MDACNCNLLRMRVFLVFGMSGALYIDLPDVDVIDTMARYNGTWDHDKLRQVLKVFNVMSFHHSQLSMVLDVMQKEDPLARLERQGV